jgi:hypothetical protein
VAIQEEYGVSSNHKACKLEMTKFLFTQQSLTIEDWYNLVSIHSSARKYQIASHTLIGRILLKLAYFLGK